MTNQKRLIHIEAALTPRPAVLLWLRQEHQGKTLGEYARWLIDRPAREAPRSRIELQVVRAILAAMKGQDPARIQQAARQAQMETDFLRVRAANAEGESAYSNVERIAVPAKP